MVLEMRMSLVRTGAKAGWVKMYMEMRMKMQMGVERGLESHGIRPCMVLASY